MIIAHKITNNSFICKNVYVVFNKKTQNLGFICNNYTKSRLLCKPIADICGGLVDDDVVLGVAVAGVAGLGGDAHEDGDEAHAAGEHQQDEHNFRQGSE